MDELIHLHSSAYKAKNYTTHIKLDYNPPLSPRFNGKELQILEWGEVKRDKLDSNIFDKRNENTAYYRIYSKEYDIIDAQDIPKLLSSYSPTSDVIDIERYYKANHLKEQDILDSMKQDTSLPEGSYYLYTKDIEQSLKIQTDFYTNTRGYKALNIYTTDTPNNQYKISYFNNPLDNIPYPKDTTFLTAPNAPMPTYHTDEKVKIFLKGSKTYKNFILNLKREIEKLQAQGYEIERVGLEVGYSQIKIEIARLKAFMYALRYGEGTLGEKGYKTIVGGGTFDDFSKHPKKSVSIKYFDTNKNEYTAIYSTAAGAYQFLFTTWSDIVSQYGKKYSINDFSPKNQDKGCIILIKCNCKALSEITNGNIEEAVKKCKKIWASLPYSSYGQRTEKIEKFLEYYNKHLTEEIKNISNLALSNEEVGDFLNN